MMADGDTLCRRCGHMTCLKKVQRVSISSTLSRKLMLPRTTRFALVSSLPCQPSMQMPVYFQRTTVRHPVTERVTFPKEKLREVYIQRCHALPLWIIPKPEGFQVFWGGSWCQSLDVGDMKWHDYLKGPATICFMDFLFCWPCLRCQD